jgi:hypothetical protein
MNAAWEYARSRLQPGMHIPNWSAHSGLTGRSFKVRGIDRYSLLVELPGGRTVPVPAADFDIVGECWPGYLAGRIQRQELRDRSRCTTYVISILHHLGYDQTGEAA